MESLSPFNIKEIRIKYGLTDFVETGTWKGDGVEQARQAVFPNIFSIEIHNAFFEQARQRFAAYPNVHLFLGASIDRLPDVIAQLSGLTLWWLDAHLQDVYGLPANMTDRFPLKRELEIISNGRNIEKDFFIMDDLRIYEEGSFGSGQCPPECKSPNLGISFVWDSLSRTHLIERSYTYAGYIVCSPKL